MKRTCDWQTVLGYSEGLYLQVLIQLALLIHLFVTCHHTKIHWSITMIHLSPA
jgi:hypothetical protein